MERLYQQVILEHCRHYRQMLFIMGPRQVGKTTTVQECGKRWPLAYYFNWDNPDHRALIIDGPQKIAEYCQLLTLAEQQPMVIFDEIHKFSQWKIFLKGLYDTYPEKAHIIVTGSARLDIFQKGGDSLMGRYFYYRFHPLSVAELLHPAPPETDIRDAPKEINNDRWQQLWQFGGYPDPFLKASPRFLNRWRNLRSQQLFREDLRDLTKIQELSQVELLATLLQQQVGQCTSYQSFAKKVRVSDKTIRRWLITLQHTYYCFAIHPWSKNITRSLLKEPKYYLWDWSLCKNTGMRAENFIASHLLKAIHFWNDHGMGEYGLYYLRDKEQREVDFVITKSQQPWMMIEAKLSNNQPISPALYHFQKQCQADYALQVVLDMPYVNKTCFVNHQPIIVPAKTFLSQLI